MKWQWAGDKVHEYLASLVYKANYPDLIGNAMHHAFVAPSFWIVFVVDPPWAK
jgi:hypothetical protein